ncbi:MAG: 6-phosphofructokinase [Candidatus Lindowbacteria bacterium]|nr:6-phosphofructokinase [Candidatus Lindowbacteria bacterium]
MIVWHDGAKKPQFYKAAKGKLRLGGIGDWLALELSKKVNSEIRTTVLGHIQRGGKPTSFDRVLASRFGSYAIKMIMNGNFGRMVALQTPDIRSVSLSEAVSHYHTVDPNSGLIRTGRALGLAFGD